MKLLLFAAAAAATATTLVPPDWLYPVPAGPSSPPPPATAVTVPGSPVTLTAGDLRNGGRAVDWFPQANDPVPAIVMNAVPQAQYACGFCHLPRGQGRPENASLAGLTAEYIIAQTEAMRTGTRHAAAGCPHRPCAKQCSTPARRRLPKRRRGSAASPSPPP